MYIVLLHAYVSNAKCEHKKIFYVKLCLHNTHFYKLVNNKKDFVL